MPVLLLLPHHLRPSLGSTFPKNGFFNIYLHLFEPLPQLVDRSNLALLFHVLQEGRQPAQLSVFGISIERNDSIEIIRVK